MKHIKMFDSQAAFDAANVEVPYLVSVAGNVIYSSNHILGYEMIDLGLSVKWAKCNVGAEKESDYGLYFRWGAVDGYANSQTAELNAAQTPTEFTDTATINMGASYRMPTKEEIDELINNTDHVVATIDSVSGMKFTKKGDVATYIFIPFTGIYSNGSFYGVNSFSRLWSSTLNDNPYDAGTYILNCKNNGDAITSIAVPFDSFPVRAVSE